MRRLTMVVTAVAAGAVVFANVAAAAPRVIQAPGVQYEQWLAGAREPVLRLAYTVLGGIVVHDYTTGGAGAMIADGEAGEPALSPSGRWLAFVSEGRLWAFDMHVGRLQPLTDGTADDSPAWGPDDHSLYFERSGQIMQSAFAPRRPLAPTVVTAGIDPACSASGRLAFARHSAIDGRSTIWVREVDGSEHILAESEPMYHFSAYHPSWSPQGDLIFEAWADIEPEALVLGWDEANHWVDYHFLGAQQPCYHPNGQGFFYTGFLMGDISVWWKTFGGDDVRMSPPDTIASQPSAAWVGPAANWWPRRGQ